MRDGNNKSIFTGKVGTDDTAFGTAVVDGKNVTTVTITDTSVTDMNKLHIAQEGILTIQNNNFNYSGFTVTKEAAGRCERSADSRRGRQ